MAKYRRIFLEESQDHFEEISRALLDLEKEMGSASAIDTIFRMAHSIKSMAASLGYDAVADLSHRMEDRMEGVRTAGRVRDSEELALLFRSLEALEALVGSVAAEQDPPPVDEALLALLAQEPGDVAVPAGQVGADPGPASPSARGGAPVMPATEAPDRVGGEPKKVLS